VGKLNLTAGYEAEARRIEEAHKKAFAVHATGDIRASGNEVECAVRQVIADRLPWRYRTTHGHVLDYQSAVSPQIDVIISENLSSKSLFETSDGTEYVPYEAVYAIGEVKSTFYRSQKPIQAFSQTIRALSAMTRQTGLAHSVLKFMFFAKANDFTVAALEEFYRETPRADLPNFVCFLDLGVIVYSKFGQNGYGEPVPMWYHLASSASAPNSGAEKWSLIKWGKEPVRSATVLMFLHLSLIQHLQQCGVAVPNLYPYLALALDVDGGEIFE
jgi:hypothetical protein